MALTVRDVVFPDGRPVYVPWWHTKTGVIVRWVLFLVFFVLVLGYVIGGYYHAKKRIQKGLQPLAYHRCLISRRAYQPNYTTPWPQQQYGYYPPQQNGYQNAYPMNEMPLPAYDPNRPPVYSGPPGGSKVDPAQNRVDTHRMPESNPAPAYAPAGR
ncbi:Chitin synthesis regulation, Congo red resistance, RCR protein [Metarhizium rileyi]|uniref:Chitin synthesis regulation, Congo red resistance, RCR protein n=1 Tax=Metarhizium rileyi (strain RCEF 4871) TaxID=1649241 RepID=A0A162LY24_METRR|nr:Chitin synthesis regulation, Congo red resistance, RCR protein [Metarhizium rileyi RCEF 4871]TWU75349.1 hypothetical protein ED733_006990 [Metarhizium rileyi]